MTSARWASVYQQFDPDRPAESPAERAERPYSPAERVARSVSRRDGPFHLFFTGTIGNGKTTELYEICRRVSGRLYEQALDIRSRLARAEPDRADHQRDLSVSLNKLADLHLALGDGPEARRLYEQALDIRSRLARAEPDRADHQRDLSVSFQRMAAVEPEQAGRWLAGAATIRREVLAREPANALLQRELAICLLQLGRATRETGAFEEGARILVELRRRDALDAQYHALADQLAPLLAGREPGER
jgi:tetratricopeptide (TPR) repeat protein